MRLQLLCDYSGYMRTGKAVPRQVSVLALKPCRPDINTRSRQLDHLAVPKAELMRICLFALYDGDEQRGKHRRKARLRQMVRRRNYHTARKICTIEQIV